jgi:hypothetical protein
MRQDSRASRASVTTNADVDLRVYRNLEIIFSASWRQPSVVQPAVAARSRSSIGSDVVGVGH